MKTCGIECSNGMKLIEVYCPPDIDERLAELTGVNIENPCPCCGKEMERGRKYCYDCFIERRRARNGKKP